jgi:hypothetical protein
MKDLAPGQTVTAEVKEDMRTSNKVTMDINIKCGDENYRKQKGEKNCAGFIKWVGFRFGTG